MTVLEEKGVSLCSPAACFLVCLPERSQKGQARSEQLSHTVSKLLFIDFSSHFLVAKNRAQFSKIS